MMIADQDMIPEDKGITAACVIPQSVLFTLVGGAKIVDRPIYYVQSMKNVSR